jgi:PRTRC genetic system protein E
MSDLFTQLQTILLSCDESLDLTVKRDGDRLGVLLVPHLIKPTSVAVPPHIEQAREVLSLPLYLQGTGPELDAQFAQRLQGYATERRTLHDALEIALQEIREASKTVRSKTGQNGGARGKGDVAATAPLAATPKADTESEEATDSETAPPAEPASKTDADVDMSQPLSLF